MEASEADIVLPTHKIDIRARRREDHSEGNPYIRRLRWIARLSLALSLSPVVRIGWQLYQRDLCILYRLFMCSYAAIMCVTSSRFKASHSWYGLDSVSFRDYTRWICVYLYGRRNRSENMYVVADIIFSSSFCFFFFLKSDVKIKFHF